MLKRRILPVRLAGLAVTALALLVSGPVSAQDGSIYQDNIVVVLDASGSMKEVMQGGQSRMEAAKGALLQMLDVVPPTTSVGVLVFGGTDASGKGLREDWIYPLGPVDRAVLEQAIRKPRAGGKTPLGRYMKKGADSLLAQRRGQKGYGTFRLLVVTDGEATDAAVVEKHLPDILSRGIAVDVIGVDMSTSHSLATRVHSYRSANDPESLKRAVAEVFAEIGDRDPVASQEAFEMLAGLPDSLAAGVISALTTPRDQPIGERPREPSPPPSADPPPSGSTSQVGRPPVPSASPTDAGGSSSWPMAVVMGVLVFAVIAIGLRGLARKGRR